MADEARAMLDALMGADRNAPVEGASGVSGGGGGGGPTRRQKRSCYDRDVCPLYCAWSLSSQENPTWAESVAANEGAGGIDVFDLFTNTKSDIGPNPYRVDDHAREEFASLPEHEKRRLGYEDMLARKLLDLVRQCDRTVSRNKEKLRREVAQAMKQRTSGSGKGNREDLIVTVNEEMLEQCASNVAQATLIEEDMAKLCEKIEQLDEDENKLLKIIEEEENSFLVSDISPEGICIVYRENDNRDIFIQKGLTYFDIMFPFRQKVSLVTEVMHIIDMPNDVKKIGLKIVEIDNQGEKFLTKYLNDLVL